MGKFRIVVLSFFALLLGAVGSFFWILPGWFLPPMEFSCRIIDEGQRLGLWSGQQRVAFVDQLNTFRHRGKPGAVPSDRRLDRLMKGLDGGCEEIMARRGPR